MKNPIDALFDRGYVYFAIKDYPDALADYNAYIKFRPYDPNVYLNRAWVYKLSGNRKAYKKDMEKWGVLNKKSQVVPGEK